VAAAYVQSGSASANGVGETTVAVTLTNPVGSGNLVCGIVQFGASAGSLTSVTDDKGNTYTLQRTITDSTNNNKLVSFWRANITNGPITVTANLGGYYLYRAMAIHEVSGIVAASALDVETGQLQTNPGTGTNGCTSGNVLTTVNGDYVFGAVVNISQLRAIPHWNAGTGFGKREEKGSTSLADICTEDLVQGSSGLVAATFTQLTNNDQSVTFVMTFKSVALDTTPSWFPIITNFVEEVQEITF